MNDRLHLTRRVGGLICAVALVASAACHKKTDSPTAPTTCDVVVGTTTTAFPAAGGSASIAVSTGSQCSWSATSDQAWLTVTSPKTNFGNGVVSFSVAANAGAARAATLTITGNAVAISLAAGS
jgi:hypothetical protein